MKIGKWVPIQVYLSFISVTFLCAKKKHENGKWVPEKKEKLKKFLY